VMLLGETSLVSEARLVGPNGLHQFLLMLSITALTLNSGVPFRSAGWWAAVVFAGLSWGCLLATKSSSIWLLPFVVAFQWSVSVDQGDRDRLPGVAGGRGTARRVVWMTVPVLSIAFVVVWAVVSYGGVSDGPRGLSSVVLAGLGVPGWTGAPRDEGSRVNVWALPLGTARASVIWCNETRACATRVNGVNAVLGTVAVATSFALLFVRKRISVEVGKPLARVVPFAVGYLCSFAELVAARRRVYAGDYACALVFGVLFFGCSLSFLMKDFRFAQGVCASLAQFASAFGFLVWSPWAYGMARTDMGAGAWLSSWFD